MQSLLATGQRRLVTILFADVSGFTAMSERLDHETTNQVMRACWGELDQVVREHGGRVDQHIGDALMATFGTTEAEADDPLHAVRAGLTLQARLNTFSQRLKEEMGFTLLMRCGVAAGEVAICAGAEGGLEAFLTGRAVNVAPKLEEICRVGSVFVNEEVYRRTRPAVEYRELSPGEIERDADLGPVYEALAAPELEPPGGQRSAPNLGQRLSAAGTGPDGSTAAAIGERRLVTILFADINGLDGLVEAIDHETACDVVRRCWAELDQVVRENGGVVDKHMGNILMATFGAAVAHEEDPLLAVRTALALQLRFESIAHELGAVAAVPLAMKCGIASGEVTVDQVARSTQELSVIGPAVNLASRIEHQPDPARVLASESVYRATGWAIEYRALEPRPIKGIDGLVPIYEALGEREEAIASGRRAGTGTTDEVVGREPEQARLLAALDSAVAGQGGVVALIGEAGMGKSTLAGALRRVAGQRGIRWLEAHCVSYAVNDPYALVREALRSLLDVRPSSAEETVLARLTEALQIEGEDPGPQARRTGAALTLADRRALVGQVLLGHETGATGRESLAALDPPTRRRLTVQALAELFLDQTHGGPMALNLEDLHWCDPESQEVVRTMADNCASVPLLLLAQLRPERDPGWLDSAQTSTLHVEPLRADEAQALVRSALRPLAPPPGEGQTDAPDSRADVVSPEVLALGARLHEATQGNPYFIVEMVRSLVESGQLVHADGLWQLAGGGAEDVGMPSSVRQLLVARMDSLEPSQRLVLTEASVIGHEFEGAAVAAISEQPAEVRQALSVLSARGFVIPEGGPPSDAYEYRHGLVREVAYETLAHWRREVYHARAGQFVETRADPGSDPAAVNLLAHHFTHSNRPDRAVHYALLAAESAAHQYANPVALTWFDQADKALDRLERPSGIEALRGEFQIAGTDADAPRLDQATLEQGWMRLLHGRAATEMLMSAYQQARQHIQVALARCAQAPELLSGQAPELQRKLARVEEAEGEYDRALTCVEQGLAAAGISWPSGADSSGALPPDLDVAAVARLCLIAGLVHYRCGRPKEAELWANRAVGLAEPAGPAATQDLAQAFNLLALLARSQGRSEDGEGFARRSLDLYESIGDLPGADKAHAAIAFALKDRGVLAEALAQLNRSKELARRIGDPARQAAADVNLGEIYLRQGDLADARACYEEALEVFERAGQPTFAATCRMNLAHVHVLEGDAQLALAFADRAAAAFGTSGAVIQLSEVLCYRALALSQLGQNLEAVGEAEEALARARELRQPLYEGQALRTLGLVDAAMSNSAEAAAWFGESCLVLEAIDAQYELGLTLLEYTRLLVAAGETLPSDVKVTDMCARACELLGRAGASAALAAAQALQRGLPPS